MIEINITNGTLSEQEVNYYVESAKQKFPDKQLTAIDFEVDGEYVNCAYHFAAPPFERIRRITGYLVGTTSRWNEAKLSELNDRVTHTGLEDK